MTADPTRPERIIAADQAATDESTAAYESGRWCGECRYGEVVDPPCCETALLRLSGTDEDAHRVYDQLDAAVESLVTSTTILADLGVATRAQERHLRRVQREMAAADERAAGDGAA